MGRKVGDCCAALREGGARAKAYLCTKWYPNLSSHLVIIDMGQKVWRHIFNHQKIWGGHSPQTISPIGSGRRGVYTLEVGADQQKILPYRTNTHFFASLSIFSLGCIKTPWRDSPSLVTF